MSEYPYCPHGTYVGGCGIDYMCQACELGDEEVTAAEQAEYVRKIFSRRFDPQFGVLSVVPLSLASPQAPRLPGALCQMIMGALGELAREQAFLDEIRRYSEHENDRQWIWRRHGERRAEWDLRSAQEQLEILPDYVLDGGY